MPRDNVSTDEFWLLTDRYVVTLAAQKPLEWPSAKVNIPKKVFDAFVDWYMTGKWRKPKA